MALIDSSRVHDLLMDCLFKPEEIENGKPKDGLEFIPVMGITVKVGLHPDRLNGHRPELEQMLFNLPESCMESSVAQGDSFLNLCNDRNGELWTGVHRTMEELLLLGIGLNLVDLAPRFMWDAFPGRVPYVTVKNYSFEHVKPAA